MRRMIQLAALVVLMTGCLKEQVDSLQFAIAEIDQSGYGVFTYGYGNDRKLYSENFAGTKVTSYVYTFTGYDAEGRLTSARQNFESFPDITRTITRDSEHRVTRIQDVFDGSGGISGVWDFTYPAANTVRVHFWDDGTRLVHYFVYTLNTEGQLIRSQRYNATGTLLTTTEYSNFDDKHNLYSFYPEGFMTSITGRNNPGNYTVTDHVGGTTMDYTNTYVYNSGGYVTKKNDLTAQYTSYLPPSGS